MKQLTISTAAAEVGVTAQTMRLWEQLGLMKVSRDSVGRRLYSPDDVLAAKQIFQQRSARRGFVSRASAA